MWRISVLTLFLVSWPATAERQDSPRSWLARQQDPKTGAWLYRGKPHVGATSLAVLSFLSMGCTDSGTIKDNRYVANVYRGLAFLRRRQDASGHFRDADTQQRALATLALCEAAWESPKSVCRGPAQDAFAALARSGSSDDPLVHALVATALRSARRARIPVAQEAVERERRWFKTLRNDRTSTSAATVAQALGRIMLCESSHAGPLLRREADAVLRHGLPHADRPDPLRTWLGTMALYQVGGSGWKKWNEAMNAAVVKTQRRSAAGTLAGSWDPGRRAADVYGRVGATALHTMCLAFYYRYDGVFGATGAAAPAGLAQNSPPSALPPHSSRIRLSDTGSLPLETIAADVRVDGFRARVRLSLYFYFAGPRIREGTFQVRLPAGASPHILGFGATVATTKSAGAAIGGRRADELGRPGNWPRTKHARMVERHRARTAYSAITSERRDPALLEWDGGGVFSARLFPLEPKKLHQVVLAYDIDLQAADDAAALRFELTLPQTKRPCEVRLNGRSQHAQPDGVYSHDIATAPVLALAGNGYTALRLVRHLPAGTWIIDDVRLSGCSDVLARDGVIEAGQALVLAGRGTPEPGARVQMRVRQNGVSRVWSAAVPAPLSTPLAKRVYGEIAVARLEPFAAGGTGVPEAYARHFRIVRETCSLLMLESARDYKRFKIAAPAIQNAKDKASVARHPATDWLKDRPQSTPRAKWRHLFERTRPTGDRATMLAMLDHVPDKDFLAASAGDDDRGPDELQRAGQAALDAGNPTRALRLLTRAAQRTPTPGIYHDLALACERNERLHLGVVFARAAGLKDGIGPRLCAQIAGRYTTGFWAAHARLVLAGLQPKQAADLVVILHWDTLGADVDLHVVDPFSDVCNWRRPRAASGGHLLADQTTGAGSEVYVLRHAVPGTYVIRVNHFRPSPKRSAARAHVTVIRDAGRTGATVRRAQADLKLRDEMREVVRVTIENRRPSASPESDPR